MAARGSGGRRADPASRASGRGQERPHLAATSSARFSANEWSPPATTSSRASGSRAWSVRPTASGLMASASLQRRSAGAFTSPSRADRSVRSRMNQGGASGCAARCSGRQSAAPRLATSRPPEVAVSTSRRTRSGRSMARRSASTPPIDWARTSLRPGRQPGHQPAEEVVEGADGGIRRLAGEAGPADERVAGPRSARRAATGAQKAARPEAPGRQRSGVMAGW